MTQPRYAPIEVLDEVRPAKHLGPPRPWSVHRPGEYRPGVVGARSRIGTAGPDQGYALLLADLVRGRVVLGNGEHIDDALAVVIQVALRRAARFGRAPVLGDLEVALGVLSYLAPVSASTGGARRVIVTGASHDSWRCREIADRVPQSLLSLSPDDAAATPIDWSDAAL